MWVSNDYVYLSSGTLSASTKGTFFASINLLAFLYPDLLGEKGNAP